MKILITENSLVASLTPQQTLTINGYDIDLAINGRQAVDAVCQGGQIYDLCLMAMDTPVMDGIEAIRLIRQQSDYYLPILACCSNPDDKPRCLTVGADDCLMKPVPSEVLTAKLAEYTVKQSVLYREGERLSLHRVGPANGQELQELRALHNKGLTKLRVVDVSVECLAHQIAEDKLYADLSCGDSVSTDLIDRTERSQAVVQIRASEISIRKVGVSAERFEQLVREEDELLKDY